MKDAKYYIYCHKDKENIVRYIGKSNVANYKRAHHFHNRSKKWHETFNNYNPSIEIIEEGLEKENAYVRETYWIKFYGRRGYDEGGTLINKTLSYGLKLDKKYSHEYYEKAKNIYRDAHDKYVIKHKEKVDEYMRKWYKENKERLLEKQRTPENVAKRKIINSTPEHKQKLRDYYHENKGTIPSVTKQYRLEHGYRERQEKYRDTEIGQLKIKQYYYRRKSKDQSITEIKRQKYVKLLNEINIKVATLKNNLKK